MSSPAFRALAAVIGGGRLGRVLADALRHADLTVHGPRGRDEDIPENWSDAGGAA